LGCFCNVQKAAQSKLLLNGRKFGESGHPGPRGFVIRNVPEVFQPQKLFFSSIDLFGKVVSTQTVHYPAFML
jgi:hypothetical protein